jgi:hypothetical protein
MIDCILCIDSIKIGALKIGVLKIETLKIGAMNKVGDTGIEPVTPTVSR